MRSAITKLQPTKILSAIWSQNLRSFSSVFTERLSDQNREQFTNLVEGMSDNPYTDYLSAKERAGDILSVILPSSTKEILRDFGNRGRSLVLLQNCPVIGKGKLPPTPSSSKRSEEKDFVSEYFMLGIADLIGSKPFLVESVRDGSIINQIIPTEPTSISGSGSRVPFDLHNEVVHEKRVPDFFLLFCLRGNPLAKTSYCLLDDIIKFLPKEILEELKKPNFLMKSGDKSIFKEAKEFRCPVLTTDDAQNLQIRLNLAPGRCEGLTDGAKIALDYVTQCVRKEVPVHSIALSQGDTLLVNNTRSLHGRTAFDENSEDDKRWVQRMNLNAGKDIEKTR